MALNKGKKWEDEFKKSWIKTFGNKKLIYRLPDQMTGRKETSKNPCDFFAFLSSVNKLFMVECKEHKDNTLPFSAFPQYERLLEYKDMENVYPGVLIWYSDRDKVVWVSIQECEKIYNDGNKSINVKMLNDDRYNLVEIPMKIKRVYPDCDLSILKEV